MLQLQYCQLIMQIKSISTYNPRNQKIKEFSFYNFKGETAIFHIG